MAELSAMPFLASGAFLTTGPQLETIVFLYCRGSFDPLGKRCINPAPQCHPASSYMYVFSEMLTKNDRPIFLDIAAAAT